MIYLIGKVIVWMLLAFALGRLAWLVCYGKFARGKRNRALVATCNVHVNRL